MVFDRRALIRARNWVKSFLPFDFLLSHPSPVSEVLNQDLDTHHLKVLLPLEGQEEITMVSRRKGMDLGQMQASRFARSPFDQEGPKGVLRLKLLWRSKEYAFA